MSRVIVSHKMQLYMNLEGYLPRIRARGGSEAPRGRLNTSMPRLYHNYTDTPSTTSGSASPVTNE